MTKFCPLTITLFSVHASSLEFSGIDGTMRSIKCLTLERSQIVRIKTELTLVLNTSGIITFGPSRLIILTDNRQSLRMQCSLYCS